MHGDIPRNSQNQSTIHSSSFKTVAVDRSRSNVMIHDCADGKKRLSRKCCIKTSIHG